MASMREEFEAICRDFPQFRAAALDSRQFAHDAGMRARLDQACGAADKAFAEFEKEFPLAMKSFDDVVAEARHHMEQAERTIAEAEQKIQEAKAEIEKMKNVVVPAPTLPALDPNLGPDLRREIVQRYFTAAGSTQGPRPGNVVDMESRDW